MLLVAQGEAGQNGMVQGGFVHLVSRFVWVGGKIPQKNGLCLVSGYPGSDFSMGTLVLGHPGWLGVLSPRFPLEKPPSQ